jgi:hypothetical protein
MNKRHRFAAVGAFLVASGAITSGAIISSNAMASTTAPDKVTLTAITVDTNGQAISCTYDDIPIDHGALSGAIQATSGDVTTAGGATLIGPGGDATKGFTITGTDGSLPAGVLQSGSATINADGTVTVSGPDGAPLPAGAAPAGAITVHATAGASADGKGPIIINGTDNSRPGTAEECAALKPASVPGP